MIGSAVRSWEQGLNKSLKLFFFSISITFLFLLLLPYLSTTRPALRMKCSSLKRYRSNAETFSCSVSTSLWENEWIREEHFILSAVRVVLDCGLFFRGVIQHQTEREWKMFVFFGWAHWPFKRFLYWNNYPVSPFSATTSFSSHLWVRPFVYKHFCLTRLLLVLCHIDFSFFFFCNPSLVIPPY